MGEIYGLMGTGRTGPADSAVAHCWGLEAVLYAIQPMLLSTCRISLLGSRNDVNLTLRGAPINLLYGYNKSLLGSFGQFRLYLNFVWINFNFYLKI
jgi:hypothetical protein